MFFNSAFCWDKCPGPAEPLRAGLSEPQSTSIQICQLPQESARSRALLSTGGFLANPRPLSVCAVVAREHGTRDGIKGGITCKKRPSCRTRHAPQETLDRIRPDHETVALVSVFSFQQVTDAAKRRRCPMRQR